MQEGQYLQERRVVKGESVVPETCVPTLSMPAAPPPQEGQYLQERRVVKGERVVPETCVPTLSMPAAPPPGRAVPSGKAGG